jgi:hypothetical protein
MSTDLVKEVTAKLHEQIDAAIEARNSAFQAMTPAEKRKTVAYDVLEQLYQKRFVAHCGQWLSSNDVTGLRNIDRYEIIPKEALDADAQTAIAGKTCDVCALGALFACTIERQNSIDIAGVRRADFRGISAYLTGIFDRRTLNLIEACFERRRDSCDFMDYDSTTRQEDEVRVNTWLKYHGSESSSERMVSIMRNIVRHEGEFAV